MITFKGKTVTLEGKMLKVGEVAPNFKVVDYNYNETELKKLKNQYIVINVVPSLDTPVCDIQTSTIYEEVFKISNKDIDVITISNDLPFAQLRWIETHELEDAKVFSDYLYNEFGLNYGALVKENKLLLRSVFVLNHKREIVYLEYAQEITQHLDYDKLLNFINNLPDN